MPLLLKLFLSQFLFLDHQILSQAMLRLCSPVYASNLPPRGTITPIIIWLTSRFASESPGKPSSTFLSSTGMAPHSLLLACNP